MTRRWTILGLCDVGVVRAASALVIASSPEEAARASLRAAADCEALGRAILDADDVSDASVLFAELTTRRDASVHAERWWLGTDGRHRALAVAAFGQIDVFETAEAIIDEALDDGDERVVAEACLGAAHRDPDRFVERVLEMSAHPSPLVRTAVAGALSWPGMRRAETFGSVRALCADPDLHVRRWASFGLALYADIPEARDVLADLLRDADVEVRGEALVALAEARDLRATEGILEELGRRPLPGTWVLAAISETPSRTFIEPLKSARSAAIAEGYTAFADEADDVLAKCSAAPDRRC